MIDQALRELVRDAVREAQMPLVQRLASLESALAASSARWVSRADAAERLGCSPDTIDRLIAAGELPSRRIGRAVRVLVAPPVTDDQIAALAAGARR